MTRQTAVDQVEDLELEKTTAADGFAGTSESISYSYRVTNTGTVTLSGTLEVDDDKIVSGDITCPAVPGGGIAPGAFLTCTGSYTTVQDDVDAGKVTNEATATLGGVTSGSDSVTVNWQAPQGNQPDLTVGSGEGDRGRREFHLHGDSQPLEPADRDGGLRHWRRDRYIGRRLYRDQRDTHVLSRRHHQERNRNDCRRRLG